MKKFILFIVGIVSLISVAQDGSPDLSFGNNGKVVLDIDNSQDFAFTTVQQNNQKLLVGGTISPDGNDYYPLLMRCQPDGSIDTSFGTDGKVLADYGIGFSGFEFVFLDNNENIFAASRTGIAPNYGFNIAKYDPTGTLDPNFALNGILQIPNENISKMKLLSDGSFILLKISGNNSITFMHYLPNGDLDIGFGTNGSASSNFPGGSFSILDLKINNSNFFVLGNRNNPNSTDIILMKFNADGYFDATFGNTGIATKTIDAVNSNSYSRAGFDFTSDQNIVIAGSYGACLDIFDPAIQPFFLRYLPSGIADNDFGDNGMVTFPISSFLISGLIVQQNQRLLVSGSLTDCFEGGLYTMKRYYSNGNLDQSFQMAPDEFLDFGTIIQEDGKILGFGNTWWYNGLEDIVLVRYNNNPLGIQGNSMKQVLVYPNPSDGMFTLQRNFLSDTDNAFHITDITGKNIFSGILDGHLTQLDLSAVKSGSYFLKTSEGVFRLLKN